MITDSEDRARHETVQRMLPKNPKRGTYAWWMKEVLRQWTGQHMLDSGFYGRAHSAPVPPEDEDPITAHFWKGAFEYVTINLGKWLESITDADDDVAHAIEQLLYWYGEWMQPREEWGQVWQDFVPFFNDLAGRLNDDMRNPKLSLRNGVRRLINERHAQIGGYEGQPWERSLSTHNFQSWQRLLTPDEYVDQAWQAFPGKAVRVLAEYSWLGEIESSGSGYTYNNENDFSQDFIYHLFNLGDGYGEEFVIIRSHNGADARGGFSDPVIARVADSDYFWSFQVDVGNDENQWDSGYYYGKDWEASEFTNQPAAMLEDENGNLVEVEEGDGFAQYPASQVRLIDPNTGEYTVTIYHEVYGW